MVMFKVPMPEAGVIFKDSETSAAAADDNDDHEAIDQGVCC